MTRPDAMHKAILDALLDGVAYISKDLRILYWNTAAERITGILAEEAKNSLKEPFDLEDHTGKSLCEKGKHPVRQTLKDGRPRKMDALFRHKHGYRVPVGVRTTPMRDEEGRILGVVQCFWDASQARDEDDRVAHLQRERLLDPLTGVGNRRFADQILPMELENLRRRSQGLGLLFVDIDHFKRVNDTYGHMAGDKVLSQVARTLSKSLRSYDAVIRWGGEEFIVVLPRIKSADKLKHVAERLRLLVEFADVEDNGKRIQVTVTIGGCTASAEDTADSLLQRADRLMYQGKTQGRNQTVICGE